MNVSLFVDTEINFEMKLLVVIITLYYSFCDRCQIILFWTKICETALLDLVKMTVFLLAVKQRNHQRSLSFLVCRCSESPH